jgi:hypothetical protein
MSFDPFPPPFFRRKMCTNRSPFPSRNPISIPPSIDLCGRMSVRDGCPRAADYPHLLFPRFPAALCAFTVHTSVANSSPGPHLLKGGCSAVAGSSPFQCTARPLSLGSIGDWNSVPLRGWIMRKVAMICSAESRGCMNFEEQKLDSNRDIN